jgi:para-aminobenzoate synthetase
MGDASGPRSSVVQYNSARRALAVTERNTTQRLASQSIFEYLRQKIYAFSLQNNDLPFNFNCGFVGYFGYELQGECGSGPGHASNLFDACFLFADRLIAFDHQEGTTYLVCFVEEDGTALAEAWFDALEQQLKNLPPLDDLACGVHLQPITFQLTRSKSGYLDDIRQCQRSIKDGETYEVCLTNQIRADLSLDPLALYPT